MQPQQLSELTQVTGDSLNKNQVIVNEINQIANASCHVVIKRRCY